MKNKLILTGLLLTVWIGFSHAGIDLRTVFVPNEGQWGREILFRSLRGNVVLMSDEIRVGNVSIRIPEGGRAEGRDVLQGSINYYVGKDASKWKRGLPVYGEVIYRDVYDGIDLIVRGMEGGRISLQWMVHPGADPSRIWLAVPGVGVEKTIDGLRAGDILISRVKAYQGTGEVDVDYVVEGNRIGFRVGHYDRGQDLIIDPVVALGSITYKSEVVDIGEYGGYYYVLLEEQNIDTTNVSGYFYRSPDASLSYNYGVIVLKVDPSLSSVIGGAILDGKSYDYPTALHVSADGVYVAGYTYSSDFPITSGAYDSTPSGGEAFVSRLSLDLGTLLSSTYLGGLYSDEAFALFVVSDGVYVAGRTQSSDFPVTPGAYDTTLDGYRDVFVSKLSLDLSSLLASTYIGGTSYEESRAIFVVSDGVYVSGNTYSTDFPVTTGAYQSSSGGSQDVFVSKLTLDLSALSFSTYLGGSNSDVNTGLFVTSDGVYVAGYTSSTDFPVTPGAYQETMTGGYNEGFISKLSIDLGNLLASTYLGGSQSDYIHGITVSTSGVYVTGYTSSPDFPVTSGAYDNTYDNVDAFVSGLDLNLSTLTASTYLGGSAGDYANAILLTPDGLYVGGYTLSPDFPVTSGSYDGTFERENEAFMVRMEPGLSSISSGTFFDDAYVADNSYDVLWDAEYYNGYLYLVGRAGGYMSLPSGYSTVNPPAENVVILKVDVSNFSIVAGTYIGGSGFEEAKAVFVSSDGVYVAGYTSSSDFPIVSGYDAALDGSYDGFVVRLSLDLGTLIASTYIGGSSSDYVTGVVVGTDGVYVAGYTGSSDFPVVSGAFDVSYNGGTDAFVSKLSLDLSSLLASTFLGGSSYEGIYDIELSTDGVYVLGNTSSSDFPVTSGAHDVSLGGFSDMFVGKLNLSLSSLLACTYLGGSDLEYSEDMEMASDGVYITGSTRSTDYPVTGGAYGGSSSGSDDAVITKLDFNLSNLLASTYLGGSSSDYGRGLMLTPDGVYVVGATYSSDFPVTSDSYDPTYNGSSDAFVVKMAPDLSSLLVGSYMGGSDNEDVYGVAASPNLLYAVGYTQSSDLPITLDLGYSRGYADMFVFSLDLNLTPVGLSEVSSSEVVLHGNRLVLRLDGTSYVGYDIYDMAGRLVKRVPLGLYPEGRFIVPVDAPSPGSYILKVRVGRKIHTLRVVFP